jgi:hypothetical protein
MQSPQIVDGGLEAMNALTRAKMDRTQVVPAVDSYLDHRARVLVPGAGARIVSLLSKFLSWLLAPAEPRAARVIAWWEKRRLFYNLALALFAVVISPFFCFLQTDYCHSFFILFLILLVGSNFCYTAGWISHLLLLLITRRPLKVCGPVTLIAGTVFSFAFIMYVWVAFLDT